MKQDNETPYSQHLQYDIFLVVSIFLKHSFSLRSNSQAQKLYTFFMTELIKLVIYYIYHVSLQLKFNIMFMLYYIYYLNT